MWQDFFGNNIALINLPHRKDRLAAASDVLNELGITYEVWEATQNLEKPCEGLVHSMKRYFKKVLSEGGERCFLFEDDILPLTDVSTWNITMDCSTQQLPEDWDMIYAGCNPASGMKKFYSENLIPLGFAYATHAVGYSRRTMEFILTNPIHEPVDNYLVREFHQRGAKIFVTYPMLMTQRPNFSDIGMAFTDWSKHLEDRYNSEVIRLITDRNNAKRLGQ